MLPLAVVDGTWISAMRTGAVTGVAAKHLARPDSGQVGIIGAGTQNKTQLMALKTVMPRLRQVKVYSRTYASAERFAEEVGKALDMELIPVTTPKEAVEGADIIVTATTVKEPVVTADWIGEGSFYSHVGGYEADFSVIGKADKIVVDDWEKTRDRGSQTLSIMFRANRFDPAGIYAQLGELVAGEKKGRETDGEFIYFSAVGLAISDLMVGKRVFDAAVRQRYGTPLELGEPQ